MRDDPRLPPGLIAGALADRHGLAVAAARFLPLGLDDAAAVYRVRLRDGGERFLKLRFGEPDRAALAVPHALADAGVPNVLAPLPDREGRLAFPLALPGGRAAAVLLPWIAGRDAAAAGMSGGQWEAFGRALRAVHAARLDPALAASLPSERFDLVAAPPAREIGRLAATGAFAGAAAAFAGRWRREAARIDAAIDRAEALGRSLRARAHPAVLCHADIHPGNVLVGDDGRIWLTDWDGPRLAPPERDLLFVVGATIARRVEPAEEARFFAGYGPVALDRDALVYFRLERIVQDLGEFGETILRDPAVSEATRAECDAIVAALLAPGGDLDRAETVALPPGCRWAGAG